MKWLWWGGKGPKNIPEWAYFFLAQKLNGNPDLLTPLKCVRQMDYLDNKLVELIRIYDPAVAEKTTPIIDFASLDECPEIIMYEGFLEKETGRVEIVARPAALKKSASPALTP